METNDELPETLEDREAAWQLWNAEGTGATMASCWTKAFARHRIAQSKTDAARIAWLEEALLDTAELARARKVYLEMLLTEAREHLNDASAAVPSNEWRAAVQMLVGKIDAALETTP